jgi:hypothetical protein
VSIDFAAGRLTLGALDGSTNQLAAATLIGPSSQTLRSDYDVRGSTGQLDLSLSDHEGMWWPGLFEGGSQARPNLDVSLSPQVPTSLTVEVGAADSQLDLSKLLLSRLDLHTGASTTFVRLPEAAGTTTARISGGASTLTIEVPANVALQVQFAGGVSSLSVDQSRFPAAGDQLYRSPNYDSAANKVDLRIEAGASTVNVR